jgi:pyridoxal phosphate enzyme (YggS family)
MTLSVDSSAIQANLLNVQERIAQAAQSAGRNAADVRLLLVTKTHPPEAIRAAVQAGASFLGENYAEEAVAKMQVLADLPGVEWHMIGHVQSRKAEMVARHFACLHALDSIKLANRLNHFAGVIGREFPVFLECNVSGEASKYGFPAWDEATWDTLLPTFQQIVSLPNLAVRGLMMMAPFLSEAEQARPYFQRLRKLQQYVRQSLPQAAWNELSMGMSADFEVAVQEGATWVRVGQAILGAR